MFISHVRTIGTDGKFIYFRKPTDLNSHSEPHLRAVMLTHGSLYDVDPTFILTQIWSSVKVQVAGDLLLLWPE